MSFLASVIPAIFVLGVLITIHEFGHFIACRIFRVRVEKFSIGFGPEVLSYQGKETRYTVAMFPLGGFVKPAGESISEVEGGKGPKPGDYLAAPIYARMAIVVAGVVMNYFLAFLLFSIVSLMGRPILGTVVGGFVGGYPAESSGLEVGDRILTVDDREVSTWSDLLESLDAVESNEMILSVDRSGEQMTIPIVAQQEEIADISGKKHPIRRLGIKPTMKADRYEKLGFVDSLVDGAKTTFNLTVLTHQAIFYMIMGKVSMDSISGPIGIITMTGTAAQMGTRYLLHLTAVLSVSLAVINLLPIPALDGGHFLFLIIEAIRRKQVSLAVQEKATQVGFFLLLALMAVVIVNDLVKINFINQVKGFVTGMIEG